MVSDFLLPWSRLNLLSLPSRNWWISEYHSRPQSCLNTGRKKGIGMARCYSNRLSARLFQSQKGFTRDTRFSFYSTSHSVYSDDALIASKMNKTDGGQQPFLRAGWFCDGDTIRHQAMWFIQEDPSSASAPELKKGLKGY